MNRGFIGLDGNDPPDRRADDDSLSCLGNFKLGRRPLADATDGGASFFVVGAVDTNANSLAAFSGIFSFSFLFPLLDEAAIGVLLAGVLLDCVDV